MTPPEASGDRELQALELALRADAPQPAPRFVHEMDARVAAGFKRPRRGLGDLFGGRLWIPSLALAGAAAVAIAVLAVAGVFGGGSGQSGAPVLSERVEHDAQVTLAGAHGAGTVTTVARMEGGRVIASSPTSVEIEVPKGRLDRALSELGRRGKVRTVSRHASPLAAHSRDLGHRMHYSRITVTLAGGRG